MLHLVWADGSLVLKQDSPYYEWYQQELSPWVHFVPFDGSEEDLLSKLQWAKEHDNEAQEIAARGTFKKQPPNVEL